MRWRLYLIASLGMIPALVVSSLRSGRLQLYPVIGSVGVLLWAFVLGSVAWLIALRTIRKAERDPELFPEARRAVLWPGGILLAIMIGGWLLRIANTPSA